MLKALSLWQPHATLMALNEKRVETRGRYMHHRGPLAIHAAQRWTAGIRALLSAEPFRSRLAYHGITAGNVTHATMPRGAIVAVVCVTECWDTGTQLPASEIERAFGNYAYGRYGIWTTDLRPLRRPVLCRGRQGLFNLPPDVEAEVIAQVGEHERSLVTPPESPMFSDAVLGCADHPLSTTRA